MRVKSPRGAQIRANLRTPLPAPWIEYGVNAFGGFAQFYDERRGRGLRRASRIPALQQQLAAANAEAAQSMQELGRLARRRAPASDAGLCAGSAAVRAHGRGDRAGRRAARAAAGNRPGGHGPQPRVAAQSLRTYAPGKTLRECADKANARQAAKAAPVAGARRQLPELRAFVAATRHRHDPGPEQALVDQAPPYNAQNFAYINTPGPYESKDVPVGLLHRAAGSALEPGGAGAVRPGRGHAAVDLGARGLARPLPAVPARQPQCRRRSRSCSRATRTPKAGRTTPRR